MTSQLASTEPPRAGAVVRRLTRPAGVARALAALVPLAAALGAWAISLHRIHLLGLGKGGLPPTLPVLWYVALGALVAGASLSSWARRPNGFVVAAYLVAVIVVLYCTVPAIAAFPRYPWLYKHVGVVRLLAAHGGLEPSVDIYNRWPGFFTLAAAFSNWAHLDALAFAGWAEPFFASVEALLVAATGLAIGRDARVGAYAALVFTLGNWVGQTYFSPQAMAYALGLALLLVFVRMFVSSTTPERLVGLLDRAFRWPRAPQPLAAPLPWSTTASVAVVIGLDAAIVATHQLTPYVLLLELGALLVLGLTPARWLILAMALLTVGYLIPNLGFVAHHYGLFTSFNPVSNLNNGDSGVPGLNYFQANAGGMLSIALLALMLASALRMAQRGMGHRALVLTVLAVAPFGIIFAQSYGGEVSLRVFLFSSPWRDVLVALGLTTLAGHRRRQLAALVVALLVTGLFVQAFYGAEEQHAIPAGEVRASEFFYAHAPAGSALVQASFDFFPARLGARYALMRGPQQYGQPNLLEQDRFRGRMLGSADIPAVASAMQAYSRTPFLVFCTSGYRAVSLYELRPAGALAGLERAVAASPRFRLWYSTPGARIYELLR